MFSRLSGAVYSFFYNPAVPAPDLNLSPKSNDWEKVEKFELNPNSGLTENAIQLYKTLQENGYQSVARAQANTYAGIAQDLVLSRHSKHPGSVFLMGKQINFQDADYFINISKKGEVNYQVKVQSHYYPIEIASIPDPTIKNIHANVITPLLPQLANVARLKR